MYNKLMLINGVRFGTLPYRRLFKAFPTSANLAKHFSTILIPNRDIKIRTMTREDLKMTLQWASKEGWNPGEYEVEPFYAADPLGYRVLEVNGEPIASLASVRHSQDLAFMGLYIVKPEFRGQGYGKLLWDFSIGTIQECRTIGLNGVLSQVKNYQSCGFMPAALNTRWQGVPSKITFDRSRGVALEKRFSLTSSLIDYDAKVFSTPREAFLKQWLKMPESHVLTAIEDGVLKGYGVISKAKDGYKIGPLFADNASVAEKLCSALFRCVGDQSLIQIDISNNNSLASDLAKRLKLSPQFDTLRMYKGDAPQTEDQHIFGLTTLEIG